MAEWFNLLFFGTFIIWNLIKVIKSIINYINLKKINITILRVNYNKKIIIFAFVMFLLVFVIFINHSIYRIDEMNKYDIPILARIQTSGIMLNLFLLSFGLIDCWRAYRGVVLFEDGILLQDKLIAWAQIKDYSEIDDNKIELKYITKKGHEQTYLIKTNKYSNELLNKIIEIIKINMDELE